MTSAITQIRTRLSNIDSLLQDGPSVLTLAEMAGGYYECPRDPVTSKRLGPLVGYAGRDGKGRQFVGDVYFNFATVESFGNALAFMAASLRHVVQSRVKFDSFCGVPEGGRSLAAVMAAQNGCRHIFAEKKVTALGTPTSREVSVLQFVRHVPVEGEEVVSIEDVCNNMSTTADLIARIEETGATCAAIACFLNRSNEHRGSYMYQPRSGPARQIPVIALVDQPFPQYAQDDPAVADDIASGNVIWKPKDEWDKIERVMACR